MYYRDATGALLVYDITDSHSFERVKAWVKELRKVVGPSISLAIAGNKCDLESKRHVPADVAQAYADEVGALHVLTSAKTGAGLHDAFAALTRSECRAMTATSTTQPPNGTRRSTLQKWQAPGPPQAAWGARGAVAVVAAAPSWCCWTRRSLHRPSLGGAAPADDLPVCLSALPPRAHMMILPGSRQ